MRLFIFLAFFMLALIKMGASWEELKEIHLINPEMIKYLESIEAKNTPAKLLAVIPNAKKHEEFVNLLSEIIIQSCKLIEDVDLVVAPFEMRLALPGSELKTKIDELYGKTLKTIGMEEKIRFIKFELQNYFNKIHLLRLEVSIRDAFRDLIQRHRNYFLRETTDPGLITYLKHIKSEIEFEKELIMKHYENINKNLLKELNTGILKGIKSILEELSNGTGLSVSIDKLIEAFKAVNDNKEAFENSISNVSELINGVNTVQGYLPDLWNNMSWHFENS